MIKDTLLITIQIALALVFLVLFLFVLDGFLDVMADPSSCESQAQTIKALFQC